jgi:sortase A
LRQTRTSLEIFAWTVGGALLLIYVGLRFWTSQAYAAGVDEMRAEMQAAELHASTNRPADQSLWSHERVVAYAAAKEASGGPTALLRIPSISLEVPVYGSVSEVNLNRGAGLIEGAEALAQGGNVGIAAHRDGFFRALKDITLDRELFLDFGGHTRRYRVVDLQIVSPDENSVLAPTSVPTITLVTCYPFYYVGSAPKRFIVRAELDDARSSSPPANDIKQVINWSEP